MQSSNLISSGKAWEVSIPEHSNSSNPPNSRLRTRRKVALKELVLELVLAKANPLFLRNQSMSETRWISLNLEMMLQRLRNNQSHSNNSNNNQLSLLKLKSQQDQHSLSRLTLTSSMISREKKKKPSFGGLKNLLAKQREENADLDKDLPEKI
jgi:hypothetical protein